MSYTLQEIGCSHAELKYLFFLKWSKHTSNTLCSDVTLVNYKFAVCFWQITDTHIQTKRWNIKNIAQFSQRDCQPNPKRIAALSEASTGKFKSKYVLSKPLMFVMVDKAGCSNDKSLCLLPRLTGKHTLWKVTRCSFASPPRTPLVQRSTLVSTFTGDRGDHLLQSTNSCWNSRHVRRKCHRSDLH